ncbi:MAG: beta-galactosidase, partial [Chitinophagaceae bacterium]
AKRQPTVSDKKGVIEVETLLDNRLNKNREVLIVSSIITPAGIETMLAQRKHKLEPNSANNSFVREFIIENPELWSTDDPNLYLVHTVIRDASTGKELDNQLNSFGLRWYNFDPEKGFSLNGKHLKLLGTNRHQCYLDKGNALPDEIHIEDIRLLKEMGGNILRIAHYPQDPLILQMCDKLGIITSVEVPIVNEITETDSFLQTSLQMTEEMVKQNFNHPSVVIWAYMNEVMLRPPFVEDSARHVQYCREVNRQATAIEQRLRTLDPARYTMIPFHGSLKRYEETGLVNLPMITGWNLYQGWYGGKFGDFDTFLSDYHKKYPAKPILITEYGADVDDRIHSFKPERFDFSVEYGDLYHEHYLTTILKNDYIAGGTIWNLNDFYSESRTDATPHVNTKGITTRDRQLKNTYLLYRVTLSKEPLAFVGTRSWVNRTGTDRGDGTCYQPLKIYSNQPALDVYLNGKLFKHVNLPDRYLTLDIPFRNGSNAIELRANDKVYDLAVIEFGMLSSRIDKSDFSEINVMLGSNRYFEDRQAKITWMPEQSYQPGSWGYVGGRQVRPKTKSGTLPATAGNILNTKNDAIFQTQREDLQSFRLDVQNGQYLVYLYWADLTGNTAQKLIYNLGNNTDKNNGESPVLNVSINRQSVLTNFEISSGARGPNGIIKKIAVNVTDGHGIIVDLTAVRGKTVLNAIRVVKIN